MKKTDAPTPYSRRVATCLNALKGVPDEWLEQYADGKSIKNIVEQSCDLVRKEEELTEKLIAAEEENAALREALKPFAAYAAHYPLKRTFGNRPNTGEWYNVESGGIGRAQIDVEDFHRAAELLKEKP